MDSKYFIPQIEDIRVGCRCGIIMGDDIELCTVMSVNPVSIKTDDGRGMLFGHDWDETWMRVPYLTKEQIEAEGWEYSANYESIEDSRFPDELGFLKELEDNLTQFLLYYHPTIYQLRIEKIYDCSGQGWIFRGKCKDINTFRYICKLLNIK
jgi:hypothetical protein